MSGGQLIARMAGVPMTPQRVDLITRPCPESGKRHKSVAEDVRSGSSRPHNDQWPQTFRVRQTGCASDSPNAALASSAVSSDKSFVAAS